MKYEETPIKNGKGLAKATKAADIDRISTGAIVWHLIKRHKFFLVTTWAVIITILYFFPFLPDVVASLL